MYSNVMKVTPELAMVWLGKNIVNNRKIDTKKVADYAEDMTAGRWQLNSEAISFNVDGQLVDGQHRLKAVIKAGVPVDMYVTYDVPNESVIFNRGRSRSIANVLQMKGERIGSAEISIAVYLLNKFANSRAEGAVESFVHDNADDLRRAYNTAQSRHYRQSLTKKAACGAVAFCFAKNGYDRDRIDRFFDIANSGYYESKEDTAAVAFRNFMIENRNVSGGGRGFQDIVFHVCAKALSDFLARKKRTKRYTGDEYAKFDAVMGTEAYGIIKQYKEDIA